MTQPSNRSELMASSRFFSGLAPATLDAIENAMQEVQFASGQHIFGRGDQGHALFLMVKGRVKLSVLTPEGRELSFNHVMAGDVFGEFAVLDGSSRSADATALTDVSALSLSGPALKRLIEQHSELAHAIIRFLCLRLREVSNHFEDVALLPIESRLARYLLNMMRGDTEPTDDGKPHIALGMSQNELALLLGASRPRVNEALTLLERSGAITRVETGFLCDTVILNELAGHE